MTPPQRVGEVLWVGSQDLGRTGTIPGKENAVSWSASSDPGESFRSLAFSSERPSLPKCRAQGIGFRIARIIVFQTVGSIQVTKYHLAAVIGSDMGSRK